METSRKKVAVEDGVCDAYCTVREAAEYARVTVETVRRWVTDGRVKASRPIASGSSRIRISVASLQALLGE